MEAAVGLASSPQREQEAGVRPAPTLPVCLEPPAPNLLWGLHILLSSTCTNQLAADSRAMWLLLPTDVTGQRCEEAIWREGLFSVGMGMSGAGET